jgi:Cu(I)/Ag(I) efflux system membrane fusion protein
MKMTQFFHNRVFHLAIAALLLAITPACSKRDGAGGRDGNVDYWTCTMHPSVREKGPGKCPICSMDLVPVMKESATPALSSKNAPQHDHAAMLAGKPSDSSATSSPSHEFVVPVERQQQIGVSFATVEMKPLSHSIRAVGRVVPETQRIWRVVSRTAAYVQELGVNAPGELVKKNQVLMKLYSPELLTTQRELIDLLRSRDRTPRNTHSAREDFQRLIESAERRLRLWNVTDEQIKKIEQTRQAEESLPILSKVVCIVQNLPVAQGANVAMGSTLVEVADLSVVCVWGELLQDDLRLLQFCL